MGDGAEQFEEWQDRQMYGGTWDSCSQCNGTGWMPRNKTIKKGALFTHNYTECTVCRKLLTPTHGDNRGA